MMEKTKGNRPMKTNRKRKEMTTKIVAGVLAGIMLLGVVAALIFYLV